MNTHDLAKLTVKTLCLALLALPVASPAQQSGSPEPAAAAESPSMLKEAERARIEAEEARREARIAAQQARAAARHYADQTREREHTETSEAQAQERARQQEEMERAGEELSRAHRELREATREIARAHREVARTAEAREARAIVREINLGDRAVIGVILGNESAAGIRIVGVSPDGPAERAGLKAGDVLVSIGDKSLVSDDAGSGKARASLFSVMDEAKPGEALAVVVNRDGESLNFDVTAERREPASWQTLIRIPDPPEAPPVHGAAPAPHVIVERVEVPRIDEEAINERIRALNEKLETHQYLFVSPDGKALELERELRLPEDFDVDSAEYSKLAEQALREANVWFGLPRAQGLELVAVNKGLGSYFKTDRGVLVVRARDDNAYRLESGDVVLEINSKPVNSPTDMMRALREIEPGSEIEIAIKRDRRNKTLKAIMPESRLGYTGSVAPQVAPDPH